MTAHYEDAGIRIHKLKCGPYDNNAYLIVCPETNDSLIIDTPADPSELVRAAKATNVNAILITHNHADHLFGFDEVVSAIDCPVGIGGPDAGALPKPPDIILEDGEEVVAGTLRLKVLSTPGHTPGSTCFVIGSHLFTGDTLFPGGPGKSGSPEALAQMIDSITGKLFVLGDNLALYPGHGDDGDLETSKQEYAVFESKKHAPGLSGDVEWIRD